MTFVVALALIAGFGTLVAARARRRTRTNTRPARAAGTHMESELEERRRSGEIEYWGGGGLF